eukprot:5976760-Pyramimonas_sp.AAC.1
MGDSVRMSKRPIPPDLLARRIRACTMAQPVARLTSKCVCPARDQSIVQAHYTCCCRCAAHASCFANRGFRNGTQ